MNLLEHYIIKVHSVEDVTESYEQRYGNKPNGNVLLVDVTYDCYGVVERKQRMFRKHEWDTCSRNGYFLA